jgi:uncharacterized protein
MEKPTLDYLREHRNALLAIFRKYHSSNVRVFGSVARGEATTESDIDFLCEPDYDADLGFYPGNLQQELQEYLGCKVDVVTPSVLTNKYLGARIQQEMQLL